MPISCIVPLELHMRAEHSAVDLANDISSFFRCDRLNYQSSYIVSHPSSFDCPDFRLITLLSSDEPVVSSSLREFSDLCNAPMIFHRSAFVDGFFDPSILVDVYFDLQNSANAYLHFLSLDLIIDLMKFFRVPYYNKDGKYAPNCSFFVSASYSTLSFC